MTDTQLCTAPSQVAKISSSFVFGPQQGIAMARVEDWYRGWCKKEHKQQIFRLFGFAGSGKTTLARHLAASVNGKVCFAAYTGKAALMMQRNGCAKASTIHSMLYKASCDVDGFMSFVIDRRSSAARAKLIVIDECSMVDEKIGMDLLAFGVPILVLGDPAQLPPVKGKGFFVTAEAPDVMLSEIHRQAKDNPIIRFANDVREGRALPYGNYGEVVIDRRGQRDAADLLAADQVIVGTNATRTAFNARLRRYLGRAGDLPEPGDKLVCLRNDMSAGVLNGGLFKVSKVARPKRALDVLPLKIDSEDFPEQRGIIVKVRREFFEGGSESLGWDELRDTQQFDYGLALTGHKSQGSQWQNVIAYDESHAFGRDGRRWLYTVITRASDRLTLIR